MRFGTIIDIGIGKLCCMVATPGEQSSLPNAGPGGSSQLCYGVYGSGTTTSEGGNGSYTEDELTDVSAFRNFQLNGTAGPNGLVWVGINPPNSDTFQYDFIKGPVTKTFTNTSTDCAFVGLRQSPKINDKVIGELNFCRLKEGQTVTIEVPENSTGIMLWK